MPATLDDILAAIQDANNAGGPTIYGGFDWASLDAQAATQREAQNRYLSDVAAMKPFRDLANEGIAGLKRLSTNPGYITETPAAKLRYKMSRDQIQQAAAARGTLLSGRTLKEIDRNAQAITADELANEWTRQYRNATIGNPFGWSPKGGAADFPTFGDIKNRYGDMFGGGGAETQPTNNSGIVVTKYHPHKTPRPFGPAPDDGFPKPKWHPQGWVPKIPFARPPRDWKPWPGGGYIPGDALYYM